MNDATDVFVHVLGCVWRAACADRKEGEGCPSRGLREMLLDCLTDDFGNRSSPPY
jgi:hypothetical protein